DPWVNSPLRANALRRALRAPADSSWHSGTSFHFEVLSEVVHIPIEAPTLPASLSGRGGRRGRTPYSAKEKSRKPLPQVPTSSRAYLKSHPSHKCSASSAFDPQPLHEALADLHRVAVGGANRRFSVDARRNQCRPCALERRRNQLVEFVFVSGPGAL